MWLRAAAAACATMVVCGCEWLWRRQREGVGDCGAAPARPLALHSMPAAAGETHMQRKTVAAHLAAARAHAQTIEQGPPHRRRVTVL
jgi:hypothetical protein